MKERCLNLCTKHHLILIGGNVSSNQQAFVICIDDEENQQRRKKSAKSFVDIRMMSECEYLKLFIKNCRNHQKINCQRAFSVRQRSKVRIFG